MAETHETQQSPTEKARMVLAELREAIEQGYDGPMNLSELDWVSASKVELLEALQIAMLVLSRTEIVPTGR